MKNASIWMWPLFGVAAWIVCSSADGSTTAQEATQPRLNAAPARGRQGIGPFDPLVIRGALLIDGTGSPIQGPVDIVVRGNRIERILRAGTPAVPMPSGREPRQTEHEIDATGMYVLPGLIDLHVHGGARPKSPNAEYAYKLWLAHGVTTVRGVSLTSNDIAASEKARSARNEIAAPRILNYQQPGFWDQSPIDTPEQARAWVRQAAANAVDGLKLVAFPPDVMAALIDEAHKLGMGTTAHLEQTGVAQMDALDAARLGLDTVTHFYGHFEALLKDFVVQPWPPNHLNDDEYHRFSQVAQLWDKIHPPGSPEWKAYLEEHQRLGTFFDPTFSVYSANRDLLRFRHAPWHDRYTLPSLMAFFEPSRTNHGSYWYYWTTWDEVAWKNFFQRWFQLVNDYRKIGGRVTTGSDAGVIYQTYGFGYINELELLQEAGFHPLEVIQAATMNGALAIFEPQNKPIEFGIVRPGLLADLVIVNQNPLENLKVLYGTGALRLNDRTNRPEHVDGVRFTVKDGIVYNAKELLADVAAMVASQKRTDRSARP